ncbi:AraC family transcriptional regulator [Arthrobacter mangrovi]|uniref:AraC family transcriptional regulator n=2 Tax=Arthrobacter mangrovi TaxID=2966350 RepID=A0ABQ5MPN5_9MICC|nr:AraC family transcriptional regulator [Arthrobacter mangrovi]
MSKLTVRKTDVDFAGETSTNFARWKSIVGAAFPPLRMSLPGSKGFRGHVRAAGSNQLLMSHISSSAHIIERRPDLISKNDGGYLKLSLHLTGTSLMVQDGREVVLQPGDMTLYDTSRPYSMVHEEDFSFLVAMFPADVIRCVAPDAQSFAGLKIDGTTGLGAMVASYMHGLIKNLDELNGPTGERLSRIGLDLIGTLLADKLDALPQQGASVQLRQIYRYIEDHLPEPDLTPSSIAAAHFISIRHLHSLFRTEGHTVAAWIRTRRLEHCRQDLGDPLLAAQSVSEIAARWGFLDAGHFSKTFRQAFGVPPSSLRRSMR